MKNCCFWVSITTSPEYIIRELVKFKTNISNVIINLFVCTLVKNVRYVCLSVEWSFVRSLSPYVCLDPEEKQMLPLIK